ncbi:MAG: DUF2344 domain-containing protein, partial [Treponema sp.]|nr:DUF2344 domain-containing protein [Treponema sp.]
MIPLKFVDPVSEFGDLLLKVEKPGRYTGGEVTIQRNEQKKKEDVFHTLIAFPDLYEIGMGNQALRIIYNRLNKIENISCDRAFAPAPDFEILLRENNIPLYGLDSGISLACLDMLMFTIGYELGLNGVLLMLDVSGIPLRCDKRNETHPFIIAGGPAVSNPLPYSPFIDAFWIGEAEAGFFDLAEELALLKKSGQGRAALLKKISSHSNVWVKGKEKASRAIYSGFSSDKAQTAVYPIPSMKITHHHGTVEIMRGCPNGCRFCHAGFWYRPMRQRNHEDIISQVQDMVTMGGWQEISLSSLSSGDYSGVGQLLEELNNQFSSMYVSFQMPSLKVSGFSLELLEKISVTRKSGLTFAVETPRDAWQVSINKKVTRDSVIDILEEAKKMGWKSAKFYFMVGLPPSEADLSGKSEEEEIVEFIMNIAGRSRMRFNINLGIFIPKPHTPYQSVSQIDSGKALKKCEYIRSKLKPLGHKVSIADPLISKIEGLLSRGDENAGLLCEQAFLGGSRLDPWNEFINREKWTELLETNYVLVNSVLSANNKSPWDVIDPCIKKEYLCKEFEKSEKSIKTASCNEKCGKCGVCGKNIKIKKNEVYLPPNHQTAVNHNQQSVNDNKAAVNSDPEIYRLLFSFSKTESAVFHGHLSLIEIFSSAYRRAGIPVKYTKGFNPIVKMEFA